MKRGAALARAGRGFGRALALVAVVFVALQLFFLGRIALLAVVDPESTTFQRSEAWRLATGERPMHWRQEPVAYDRIATNLKRAVIASEDAGFAEHGGVEWDALEKAYEKNQRAEAVAERANARLAAQAAKQAPADAKPARTAKVVGGSTITQQLAKNLFLSGERNFLRKGQELLLAVELEAILGKRRILDVYLNSVEWGEGVFGAEAAAGRYFRVPAASLSTHQAAQLAVMLPAPKRFEKRPGSAWVAGRTATIAARLGGVEAP